MITIRKGEDGEVIFEGVQAGKKYPVGVCLITDLFRKSDEGKIRHYTVELAETDCKTLEGRMINVRFIEKEAR